MYPTALPSYAPFATPITLSAMQHTNRHKDMERDIAALALKVGIDSSADTSSVDYKLTSALASIVGIGTRITNVETGSEAMASPAITSFTNSAHNHTNAAGGGQLPLGALSNDSTWAMQSWTPTWTNLTVGDGTVVARFVQMGKIVFWRLQLIFGAGTSISGLVSFSIPVTAKTSSFAGPISFSFFDSSASNLIDGASEMASTTVIGPTSFLVSGNQIFNLAMNATNPWTWAVSDQMRAKGWYEAA